MRVGNIYGSCLTETSEKRLDISIYIYISTKVELFGSPFFLLTDDISESHSTFTLHV